MDHTLKNINHFETPNPQTRNIKPPCSMERPSFSRLHWSKVPGTWDKFGDSVTLPLGPCASIDIKICKRIAKNKFYQELYWYLRLSEYLSEYLPSAFFAHIKNPMGKCEDVPVTSQLHLVKIRTSPPAPDGFRKHVSEQVCFTRAPMFLSLGEWEGTATNCRPEVLFYNS